jgi:NTE family protein
MAELQTATNEVRDGLLPSCEVTTVRAECPLALVMGGGGARAAYQVGTLRWLARRYPNLDTPILVGVSAGAINAVMLAAHEGDFRTRVDALAETWSGLEPSDVFRTDGRSILRTALVAGLRHFTGRQVTSTASDVVDTRPLWRLLARVLGSDEAAFGGDTFPGIAANLRRGALRGIAITTTGYADGRSVTWVQGNGIASWDRPDRRSIHTTLGLRHVIASAALPLLFPAVEIDGGWFADGGVGLTAPLSPAVHMGADRVLAITTRCAGCPAEGGERLVNGYPRAAHVVGTLFESLFPDLYDSDAQAMERRNRIIASLPPAHRSGFRRIRPIVLRPSRDLGALANEFEPRLPKGILMMTGGREGRGGRSNEAISLMMFQPDYVTRLIELGEADAEVRSSDLEALLGVPPRGCPEQKG